VSIYYDRYHKVDGYYQLSDKTMFVLFVYIYIVWRINCTLPFIEDVLYWEKSVSHSI